MSKQLLLNLNGNKNGLFRRWLDAIDGEPRIAWYPSAGEDFRGLMYLHSEFARQNPATAPDPRQPDIFLYSDYYPWESSTFLDRHEIYRDERTSIILKSIEELPRCDLPLDDKIVSFPEGSDATGRVLFLDISVSSTVVGNYSFPVVYAFAENAAFCSEKILPNRGKFSHIIHIRFGGGLGGGGKSTGIWLLNLLRKLECEVFINDGHFSRGSGDERIYELYAELAGDEDLSQLEQIRSIASERWSGHGDVSWDLVSPLSYIG